MQTERARGGYVTWRSRQGWELWAHWTCALVAGGVAVLADRWLGRNHGDMPAAERRLAAALAGLAAVASVALHELGHLFAARRLGLNPVAVVVAPLAGGTTIPRAAPTPASEAAFVLAGPAASLAAAGVAAAAAARLPRGPLRATLGLTATANVLLTATNLAPTLPTDGGVALRSLSWYATGDRDRATEVSRSVGRATGVALIGLGLLFVRKRAGWALLGTGLATLFGGGAGEGFLVDPFRVIKR
jgi:Zn-dependent protease